MKQYAAIFLVLLLASEMLVAQQQQLSAFGAGNLDSNTPYGLSNDEKAIYSNKKNIEQLRRRSFSASDKINSLRERIDGLQTILEGMGNTANKSATSLKSLSQNIQNITKDETQYRVKVQKAIDANTAAITALQQQMAKMQTQLQALDANISSNYVSKQDFNKLVTDINNFKALVTTQLKKRGAADTLSKMSKKEIYNKAYKLYSAKSYAEAERYYKYLIQNHYMPATSNYMIGEIKYNTYHYGESLAYYKESAKLYTKSKFMPQLLLHSAIAMQKTGDKKNAKKFFNALILEYPKTSEAKQAKNYLKH
jgi:TolA-binding protein